MHKGHFYGKKVYIRFLARPPITTTQKTVYLLFSCPNRPLRYDLEYFVTDPMPAWCPASALFSKMLFYQNFKLTLRFKNLCESELGTA